MSHTDTHTDNATPSVETGRIYAMRPKMTRQSSCLPAVWGYIMSELAATFLVNRHNDSVNRALPDRFC